MQRPLVGERDRAPSPELRDQIRRIAALALTLFLCAAIIASRGASSSDRGSSEWNRSQATAVRLEQEWPLVDAGPVSTFIRQLGERLARATGPAPYPWRFRVIRDRSANAFAIGGGRIYVSDGTIPICRDEAELAAIVAHEMGHQLAGHFQAERLSHGRELPRHQSKTRAIDGADAANVTIGSLKQEIDPVKEQEADRWSVRILMAAGYDPHASLRVAQRVLPHPAERGLRHFADEERSAALAQLLAGVRAGGRADSQEFRRLKRQSAEEPE